MVFFWSSVTPLGLEEHADLDLFVVHLAHGVDLLVEQQARAEQT